MSSTPSFRPQNRSTHLRHLFYPHEKQELMSERRRVGCDLFLSRSWMFLIQEPRKSCGAYHEQRFLEQQYGIVCRVV